MHDTAKTVLVYVGLGFFSGFLTCAILWIEIAHARRRSAVDVEQPSATVAVKHRAVDEPRGGTWANPNTPPQPTKQWRSPRSPFPQPESWKPEPKSALQ